jgi:hypothetical protein
MYRVNEPTSIDYHGCLLFFFLMVRNRLTGTKLQFITLSSQEIRASLTTGHFETVIQETIKSFVFSSIVQSVPRC